MFLHCGKVLSLLMVLAVAESAHAGWMEDAGGAFRAGDFEKVVALAQPEAESGDHIPNGLAAAYVAAALTMMGDFEGAQEWHERAEVVFKSEKADMLVGRLQVARAVAAFLESRKYSAGAPEDALAYLEKAKTILNAEDVMLQMVMAEMMGRSSKAVHVQNSYLTYMKLIARFESAGDSLNLAHSCVRLAAIDGASGGHQSALTAYLRGARIFAESGDLKLAALSWRNAGHASRKVRDYDRTETLLKKALAFADSTGDLVLIARVHNDLSRCYMEMERQTEAEKYDRYANESLSALGAAIQRGDISDSVDLDFYHLFKARYASLLLYETDLWYGFYDQLVVREEN